MKKVFINAPLEYVAGHLRSGVLDGYIKLTDEEFEEFKKNPADFLYDNDYISELPLKITDYEVDDRGPIDESRLTWGWNEMD